MSATLNGVIYSNQEPAEVTYWFNYGTTTDYGTVTPDRTYQIPADSMDDRTYAVSEPISGLEPNTTYHYQACTSPGIEPGSRGCTNQDQTFTTAPAGSGRSGIAFRSTDNDGEEISVINADGTGQTRLTTNPDADEAPAWSPDGAKITWSSRRSGNYEIFSMDADGSDEVNLTNGPTFDFTPAWSPDGGRIAFACASGGSNFDLCLMDADGANQTPLIGGPSFDGEPAWSPDGSQLAFVSNQNDEPGIYVMQADGSDPTRVVSDDQGFSPAWSPDGSQLAFSSSTGGNYEIYVANADGTNQVNLTNDPAIDWYPTWSPDGTELAFSSGRAGNYEIYRMQADGSNPVNVTNTPDISEYDPAWSPRP